MFRHNLRIIFRNFIRNKSSFFINLIGLSTGLACTLLIYLWVNGELNMDKFNEKDSQLYQILNNFETSQGVKTLNATPVPLADALVAEMPEVEHAAATNAFLFYPKEGILSTGNSHFKARGMFATEDLFDVFSYRLVRGEKNQVLATKNGIIISEVLAKKIFNTTDNIIGHSLEWEHTFFKGTFEISGIFETCPANATTQFNVIFNIEMLLENDQWAGNWTSCYAETFVILRKGTNVKLFNNKIANFLSSKHPEPNLKKFTLFLQKFSDRYLHGQYENGAPSGGRITYVRLFSIIALFILIIACINFMNLSTAIASRKMKEVGVKKTVGASRKALIIQFLTESMLMALLSMIIAILLVEFLLPQFNIFTGKNLSLQFNQNLFLSVLGFTLLTGILAGSYPALNLSGLKPMLVLKGKLNTSFGELWVRKGLVIFQFALSVIFIVSVLIINKQIEFVQNKNLGYNRENILCFQWKGEYKWLDWDNHDFKRFMTELKRIPGVVNATSMSGNILNNIYAQTGVTWSGKESERDFHFQSPVVGYDFFETLGIEMKEGRTFSREFNDDYSKIIINEACVELMELENPVGKTIGLNGSSEIIGVVKNFHYGSLHNKVEPLIFRFEPIGQSILVKISTTATKATIERIKDLHSKICPKYPFEFTFMDNDYQTLYNSEMRVGVLSKYFAAMAIIISCLGLFGLTAFSAERRRKEIGIRKVLGSSEFGIIYLLSSDFTKLVIASIIIALPVSYFITKHWLESFAYRINLQIWYFIGAAVITLIIAWLTVGAQAIRSAMINPVQCLRDE